MENEGYRGWKLSNGLLVSMNDARNIWRSSTFIAWCDHGCRDIGLCLRRHKCGCGIYSLNNLSAVIEQYSYSLDIYGIVYNHGVVIEGDKGFRAEKATIRCLYTADMKLAKQLALNYPDVSIMLPPPEVLVMERKQQQEAWKPRSYDYMKAYARKKEREALKDAFLAEAKGKYPGGPEEEKLRLRQLHKGASRANIQAFCKVYGSNVYEWAMRNWIRHPGGSTKAKPGDMVFETNEDTRPLVYISSCRNRTDSASIRWCMDRNGILKRLSVFEKWDADEMLIKARRLAIEEWE